MSLISIAEKKYICDGVLQDIRNDGRRNNQFRNIEIETNLLQQSHGSSRVRFTNGGTDVVTSIKAEVQPITDGFKLENMIEASVVFTASASKDYHTRIVKTEGDLLAQSIEDILKSTGAMDLKELVIVNKMFCWKIYVDVEVYDDSGNVFDLIMLSVLVALRTTRLPITTAIRDLNQNEKEFDIDQDPTHFRRLSCMGIPIAISIYTIKDTVFIDASEEEEFCAESMIIVCVNRRKEIVSVQNQQGRIQGNTLFGCLHVASTVAEELFRKIDEVVDMDDMHWTTNELPSTRGLFV